MLQKGHFNIRGTPAKASGKSLVIVLLLESNQERIILIGSETKCHAGFDVHWNLVVKFFDNLLT